MLVVWLLHKLRRCFADGLLRNGEILLRGEQIDSASEKSVLLPQAVISMLENCLYGPAMRRSSQIFL
jgi:hypothetical protein